MRSRNQRSCDDHDGAAREVEQRLLERAQRFDVEVVRRLVEQQQVAARSSAASPGARGCARRPRARRPSSAGRCRWKLNAADVGARRASRTLADRASMSCAVGDLLATPSCRARARRGSDRRRRAATVSPTRDRALVGLSPGRRSCVNERRLAGAVRADDADDAAAAAGVNDRSSNSSLSPNALPIAVGLDDQVAEARAGRDVDLACALRLRCLVLRRAAPRSARGAPCPSRCRARGAMRTHSSSRSMRLAGATSPASPRA